MATQTTPVSADSINAAIASGDVTTETAQIKANINGKDETRDYTKYTAVTLAGALALCGGRENSETRGEKSVLGLFNYGFDLAVRASERSALMASVEDPMKNINKAAKALVAAGLFSNEEDAVKHIQNLKTA